MKKIYDLQKELVWTIDQKHINLFNAILEYLNICFFQDIILAALRIRFINIKLEKLMNHLL